MFEIIQIPQDDASVRSFMDRYKAFRLLSLKTAPNRFGSTYEREIAFTDDVWYDRLANGQAVTFVAVQGEQFVCALTMLGPLPGRPDE